VQRVHMNYLRDLIHRLRARQSERATGRDLGLSQVTVHKYRLLAEKLGLLDSSRPLPEACGRCHIRVHR